MAEAFNLNTFLQTYKHNTYDPTKQHAIAEEKMETKLQEQAREAVEPKNFLSLTLSEKMAELGLGERTLKQVADTAIGMVTDIVNPIEDYLAKYENIIVNQIKERAFRTSFDINC